MQFPVQMDYIVKTKTIIIDIKIRNTYHSKLLPFWQKSKDRQAPEIHSRLANHFLVRKFKLFLKKVKRFFNN